MLFNSLHFALFFGITYLLYLKLHNNYQLQNKLLLAASFLFYAFWDWRFLSLVILSIFFNYYLGLKIDVSETQKRRKLFLVINLCLNLVILGFFKYYNFFAESLEGFFDIFGWHIDVVTLNIILPLGISFYTFQAMSYTIDIYRRVIKSTNNLSDFALFVSFFPLISAGPIERARNMLPQIQNKREITLGKFYEGSWLFFWGLYKKIFIADNLAKITKDVFENTTASFPGGMILVATYAFAFQIYADFSGYSDMARGIARAMGFDVMLNFRNPFFSKNVYDFWQRWHISLTTWIKEYIFYPLALAKFFGKEIRRRFVIIITWAIMGFWHGAAWKYVFWGIYHGVVIVIYNAVRPYISFIKLEKPLSHVSNFLKMLLIFHIFCVGILFFAVGSSAAVLNALRSIIFRFSNPYNNLAILFILYTGMLILIEYFQYRRDDEFVVFKWPFLVRGLVYYLILYSIILCGDFNAQRYYYFQF